MKTKHFPVLDCFADKIDHNFSCRGFFSVKREKELATDRIHCKHENGLMVIRYIYNAVRLYQKVSKACR